VKLRGWCLGLAWIGLTSSACLDHELPPEEDASGGFDEDGNAGGVASFVPFARDFEAFESWMSFEVRTGEHAGVIGTVRVYINALPPSGSREFPVGTIIVKTVEVGDKTTWSIHSMVKRGGGFNAQGALDWEFYDLRFNEDEIPVILWRGADPPAGHGYETLPGLATGTEAPCNSCHLSARNDAVLSESLQLETP